MVHSSPSISLYSIDNALVFGGREGGLIGYVRDRHFDVILESHVHTEDTCELAIDTLKHTRRLKHAISEKGSAFLLDLAWSSNIFHWLTECVPAIVALEDAGFDGVYLTSGRDVHVDTLTLIGMPASRIKVRRPESVLHECVFVACGSHGNEIKSDQIRRIRAKFGERIRRLASLPSRLYIPRRGEIRSVCNEEEVLEALRPYNLTVVYLEDYTIEEQIRMTTNADVIIGPHGAGLAFSLFMHDGGALIEFFGSRFVPPCMFPVCETLGLQYHALPATVPYLDDHASDEKIRVNLRHLKLVLRQALGDKPNEKLNFG